MARLVVEDWSESVSPDSKLPMHAQLTDILLARLGEVGVHVGDVLPGEWDLADHFQISRNTARRAYGELVTDGYLRRRAGVGTVLVQKPGSIVPTRLINPSDEFSVALTGNSACFRTFVEDLAPPHEVCDFLGSVELVTAVDHHASDGRVLASCTWWFRTEVVDAHHLLTLRNAPAVQLTQDSEPPIVGERARSLVQALDAPEPLLGSIRKHLELEVVAVVVSARRASRLQAQLLDLGVRSPVLEVHTSHRGPDGGPAAYALATWAGDEFGLRTTA